MTRIESGFQGSQVPQVHFEQRPFVDSYPPLPVRAAEHQIVDLPRQIAALKQSDVDPTVIGALYDRLDAAYEVLNSY